MLLKCIHLNRECSFAILLQIMHHGKNVAKSFVKNPLTSSAMLMNNVQ
jgi:hypothetical protein